MELKRRVRSLGGSLLLGIAALHSVTVFAAAPKIPGQAPGYFRMTLGNFEITALSDGTVKLPMDKLLKTSPERVKASLAKEFLTTPLETSVNAYLVNTGDKLILIDTGSAQLFGPTLGNMLANLAASGYKPEQIDEVLLTHFHPDHVGGLIANGMPAFPNATVRADRRDADFWLSEGHLNAAADADKDFFRGVMASINPYVQAGHFKPFDGATNLEPGISAIPTYGHTVGHTSYLLESQGQKLLVMGDLIHVAAVQLQDPAVTIGFDSDAKNAAKERRVMFDQASQHAEWVAGAHLSFPGIGHLKKAGRGYTFTAINYTTQP